jgi:hypothetical protein
VLAAVDRFPALPMAAAYPAAAMVFFTFRAFILLKKHLLGCKV